LHLVGILFPRIMLLTTTYVRKQYKTNAFLRW